LCKREDDGKEPCEATDERGDEMKKKKKNPHIGSSLDEFLKEEGILEETRTAALKESLAWQVQKAMKRAKIDKVESCSLLAKPTRVIIASGSLKCRPVAAGWW
jgi:hypothetical protein